MQDFFFEDLSDSVLRHQVTDQSVIPRTRQIETAKDRFTKESEKATREKQIVRTDYTARPNSFDEATTRVLDRHVRVGEGGPIPFGARISTSELHYAQIHHGADVRSQIRRGLR